MSFFSDWRATWRDYAVDGVPASGPNRPSKADIRALGEALPHLSDQNIWTAPQKFSITSSLTSAARNAGLEVLINGADPDANNVRWQGGNHASDAFAAAIIVPSDASAFQVNAIAAHIVSNRQPLVSGGTPGGDVAGYFFAEVGTNGANVFGINPVCVVGPGLTSGKCQNEFDFNINSPGITVTGLAMMMSGTVAPAAAVAFAAQHVGSNVSDVFRPRL